MCALAATIAVIFDFDDTLVPDSTSKLLEQFKINSTEFWSGDAKALVARGYDPALAYLRLLLERIGPAPANPLGPLTNEELRRFGAELDGDFYKGMPDVLDDLRRIVGEFPHIDVEFYV